MRPPKQGEQSPWGAIQTIDERAPGIVFASTAGHGGYWLSEERVAALPAVLNEFKPWCGQANWFEEDCDWAVVALAFPEHFDPYSRYLAVGTLKGYESFPWAKFADTEHGKAAVRFADEFLKAYGKHFHLDSCGTSGEGWSNSASALDGSERIDFYTKDYCPLRAPFSKEQLLAAGIQWHPKQRPQPARGALAEVGARPIRGYCSNDYEDSFSDADPGL